MRAARKLNMLRISSDIMFNAQKLNIDNRMMLLHRQRLFRETKETPEPSPLFPKKRMHFSD